MSILWQKERDDEKKDEQIWKKRLLCLERRLEMVSLPLQQYLNAFLSPLYARFGARTFSTRKGKNRTMARYSREMPLLSVLRNCPANHLWETLLFSVPFNLPSCRAAKRSGDAFKSLQECAAYAHRQELERYATTRFLSLSVIR